LNENTPIDWETKTAAEINDFIQKEPNAKKIKSFIEDMIDKNYLTKAHDKNVVKKKYETQLKQLSEDALDYAREALEREFTGRRAPKRKLPEEAISRQPSPQKRSTVSFVTETSEVLSIFHHFCFPLFIKLVHRTWTVLKSGRFSIPLFPPRYIKTF
jgi:hypothetical protein